jgi:hypothetical protein
MMGMESIQLISNSMLLISNGPVTKQKSLCRSCHLSDRKRQRLYSSAVPLFLLLRSPEQSLHRIKQCVICDNGDLPSMITYLYVSAYQVHHRSSEMIDPEVLHCLAPIGSSL